MNETVSCAAYSPECHGRLEWHHALSQSRLKRKFKYGAVWEEPCEHSSSGYWLPTSRYTPIERSSGRHLALSDILGDTRNRIWACSYHHEKITNARIRVELPESVHEFAAEFGFTAALENDARRTAA